DGMAPRVREVLLGPAIRGAEVEELTVEAMNGALLRARQSPGVLDDRREHGLEVERRARHRLEDFARRGLLLACLVQRGARLLELRAQLGHLPCGARARGLRLLCRFRH